MGILLATMLKAVPFMHAALFVVGKSFVKKPDVVLSVQCQIMHPYKNCITSFDLLGNLLFICNILHP